MAQPVYTALRKLHEDTKDDTRLREQKSQAVELYTYLATWGLMRLKAEELALSQEGKKDVVKAFFRVLEEVTGDQNLANDKGLEALKNLDTASYLGLTGLGLQIAREFTFWATTLYADIKSKD
ncbi:MAG: hypothetical protein P3X23_003890 [Thermosynechococcus sp. Uc]|uniref:hypothetical protein n=1 Tax=Thermosynechococcus sp. Uc TaxID=3034853 RepID=UPI0019D98A96|nr:hypothetical protein [Thermosynechococcus sp. Uc]MDM7326246.1 hypothetical protein [Thermosynechococcus sp. Uc]HIK24417.1 hypothetical protein [Thermosynechococcus sp. M46_R2017_013]